MTVRVQFTPIRVRQAKQIDANIATQAVGYTQKWAEDLKNRMQDYPPVPTSSKYVRTDRLKGNWKVRRSDSGNQIRFFVGNNTRYGPYVQGSRQTSIHAAHGWVTIQQTVDREGFNRGLQAIIKGGIHAV